MNCAKFKLNFRQIDIIFIFTWAIRKRVTTKIKLFKDKCVETGYSSIDLESFTVLIIQHSQRIYIVQEDELQKSSITAYIVPIKR